MKKISTLFIALTICCFSINSFAQLSFDATPDNGCAPLTVTFSNTSSDPNAYHWYFYFGDGNSFYKEGTFSDTTYTYTTAGDYNPYMQVYDASWSYIGIGYNNSGNPVSVIGGTNINSIVDSACMGDFISFSNYNNNTTSWFWDFGDGNTSTDPTNTNHIYSSNGDYTVSVTVSTPCGNFTSTKNIAITNNVSPSPMNFGQYPNPACINQNIVHNPYGNAASYLWNFGDGNTSTESNPYHTYDSAGTFPVTLTVTNGCNNSASYTDSAYIVSYLPFDSTAFIDMDPDSACPNTQISFWAPYNGNLWIYDFGDGSPLDTGTSYYRYHTFPNFGNYTVSVKIFNDCGNDTTYTVTVPIVNTMYFDSTAFIEVDPDSACPNENINFWAPYSGTLWIYDFGDGSPLDTGDSYYRYHAFPNLGNYTVSVKMFNACGNDTTYTVTVPIVNTVGFPSGMTINHNAPVCPNENVNLNAPSGYNNYVWNYGDLSPSDSSGNPYSNHYYSQLGSYTVSVSFTNNCGIDTTLFTTVNIENNQPIPSNVYVSNNSPACPGAMVQLYADYGFAWYVWDYGDGSTIDSLDLSNDGSYRYHTYDTVGTYTASVTIYNNCGSDTTLYTTVEINTNSSFPTSVYFNSGDGCPNDNIYFNSESGYVQYVWDFGDGISVTTNDNYASHSYGTAGTYNASLTITNACGNDSTLTATVNVLSYIPFPNWVEVLPNDLVLCPGQSTSINANYGGAASYQWNFGDGTPVQTNQNNYVYHTYTALGQHTISLTITNNCGNDTTVTNIINVDYPPFGNINISANASPACPQQPVDFNTQYGYYKYIWDFGDGSPLYVTYGNSNSNHAFADTGTYTVSVKILNNCGVDPYQYPNLYKDTTIYYTITINNTAGFSGNASLSANPGNCSSDYNFYSNSGYASYEWDFGDGEIDTTASGSIYHLYSDTGSFTANVTLTNYCGADTTLYYSVYHNQAMYGSFIPYWDTASAQLFASPNLACPNQNINFNTGGNYYIGQVTESVYWDFGDGTDTTISSMQNGTADIYFNHIYTGFGTFTVEANLTHQCGNDTSLFTTVVIDSTVGFPNGAGINANNNPCVNEQAGFYASSGFASYEWDFGDTSSPVTTSNYYTNHQYSDTGSYSASVIITNFCGNDTTLYKTINVTNYKPFPEWSFLDASPIDPCPGENVGFYVDAGWENVSYEWNFGDGTPVIITSDDGSGGNGGNYINHSFADTGTYTASVTITNKCGNDTTLQIIINVVSYKPFPNWVSMNHNPEPACPGDYVFFNSAYGFANYQWDFGDGETGQNYPNVNHIYGDTGTYTAIVTITNFCGNDTTLSTAVNINGDIEFGQYTPMGEQWYLYAWPNNACPGQNVNLQAPYGLPYYIWDFGDGMIDSTSNYNYINHKYSSTGTYTVALTMKNNCGSDTTLYTDVYIDDNLGFQYLYMNISPTTACPNQEITVYGPYGYASYVFDYGDGSPTDSSSDVEGYHYYDLPGTYNVGLKIYNYCGLDTIIYAPVNIDTNVAFSYAPNVSSNPYSACPNQEVYFQAEGGHMNYLWNFNDGSEASGSNDALHAFDSLGNYNVKVTITNFCGDDTTVSVNVIVSDTISTFPNGMNMDAFPSVSCPGDMVQLETWSGYVSYYWTFGDGDTLSSTGNNVEHIYTSAGNYNASVKITNGCGFSTTIYQSVTINSNAPVDTALIIDIPFNPNCPGDEVFFNIEGGANTYIYNWDFGDNSTDSTVGTGTSHSYSDTGMFSVTLTATNGCGNSETYTEVAEINNSTTPFIEPGETFGFGAGESEGVAGCPNDAILFWFAGTYNNSWDFGDGTSGTANEQVMTDMGLPVTVIKHIYSNAGTYSVKLSVTNSCGNTITDSIEVEITSGLLVNGDIFIAPPTGSSGYTTCMSIDMIGTGGASYGWDFGDGDTITTISPTISHTYSQPGTYTVKLKVTNGCGYSATYFSTITVNGIGGPDVSVASSDASCNGSADGSATVTVNDGISPFTYQWDVNAGSQTGATANTLEAGTYNVTVTDAINCASVEIVNVSQPTDMAISSSTTNSTCGASDGDATVSVSGGSGSPYTYVWSTGGTSETETGLAAGNYTVTVTNGSGCSKVGNVSVNNGNAATVSVNSSTNISCNGNSDGAADITISGGTSPYNYLWSNAATTEDLTNLTAGTYSLTVTDANGCVSGQSVVITQPNALSSSTSVTNANCGAFNGSATVNVSGGTAPYVYNWSSGSTSATASGLPAGTYYVTVTDNKGCVKNDTANVSNANAPTITSVVNNVSCNGVGNGSIDLTVTGGTNPYSYNWSTGSNSQDQNNLAPSNYLVIIQDASGCQAIRNFTITQPDVLTASASSVAATCGNADGGATVTQSGGNTSFSYLWNNGQTAATATGLVAGNYSVTVTDNIGCSATANTSVTQPSTFASAAASDSVSCNGGTDGSASATPVGGNAPYSYLWNTGDTTSSAIGLPSSVYSVTITDVNNCTSENSATVSQPNALATSFTIADASCFGGNDGSVDVSVSGGTSPYTYLWDDGSTSSSLIGLSAAVYYVTATDANNCTLVDSADVGEASALTASFTINDVACFGNTNGSINLVAGGGTTPYSYLWNDASTNPNLSGLPPATYYVTITDDNSCIKEDSATVGEPQQLSATVSSTAASCKDICDGTATVTPNGGTSPYTYLWTNGDNSATADSLCDGNYTVNISDGNNCQVSQIATIAEPLQLSVSLSSVGTTCGNSDGTSTASANGGTMPYNYLWNDNQTDSTTTALGTGAVSVTVTDNNGCTVSANDTIGTYVPPVDICIVTVDTSSTKNLVVWEKPIVNYIDSFRIYRDIVGTYTYIGSVDYIDLSVFTDTTNGVNPQITSYRYKISVVDNCGNESAMSSYHKTMNLQTIFQQGEVNLSWDNYEGFGTSYYYVLRDSTGAGNWQVLDSVSFGNTQWTDINPPSGLINYMMEVVHPFGGCEATLKSAENHNSSRSNRGQSANVAALSASATPTDATQGNCDGTAIVEATGGLEPYSYQWDNNAGSQTAETATNLCAGNYSVTVTDALGSTATATVTVLTSGSTLSGSATSTDANAGNCDGTATVAATGGTAPYTYQWSANANGQTTETVSGLCAGSYSVTVTDADENTFIVTTNVGTVGSTLSATATATNTTDTVNCNGTASAIPSGGTAPYTYLWSNAQTDSTATGLCAGSYTVTVTDAADFTFVVSVNVGVTVMPFVSEVSLENSVMIFPNPNNGKFQLSVSGNQYLVKEIIIYNLLGEEVYSKQRITNNEQLTTNLSSGIYFIQISAEGETVNRKIVVE